MCKASRVTRTEIGKMWGIVSDRNSRGNDGQALWIVHEGYDACDTECRQGQITHVLSGYLETLGILYDCNRG